MTSHLTGPDVHPDVRAAPTLLDYRGPTATGDRSGALPGGDLVGPPISVTGDRQDGGMEPVEPRGRWSIAKARKSPAASAV